MKTFLVACIIVMMSTLVSGTYITNHGINSAREDYLLNSVDSSLVNGIDKISFVNSTGYNATGDGDTCLGVYRFYWHNYTADKVSYIDKTSVTLYAEAFKLDDHQLRCVFLHELGHHDEAKSMVGGKIRELNETYADEFATNIDNTCVW